MSSSVHIDTKKKDISILDKGLERATTLRAEAEYAVNFSRSYRKFCLSTVMGATVFYLKANISIQRKRF